MNAVRNIAAVELSIDGMTCASCAHRIEKKLNKLDGVTATVNFATEKAHVEYGDGVKPEQLVATVEEAGYQVHLPETPVEAAADDPTASLRQRLLISAVLTVPVVAMAMMPALSSETATRTSVPSRWIATSLAPRCSRARSAEPARRLARTSK